jgi:hypothetical protein
MRSMIRSKRAAWAILAAGAPERIASAANLVVVFTPTD